MKSSRRIEEGRRKVPALLLVVGPLIFPLGSYCRRSIEVSFRRRSQHIGAGLVITALAGIALGFARTERV